jgi:hypothetical protein
MPSGFQQDQNQLTPSFYRVIITSNNDSTYWPEQGDGSVTNEGRISPFAWDNFTGTNQPSTLLGAQALARGNLRFQSIVEAIENLADCQILDIETNAGGSADAQMDNTGTVFTVKFDRDEGVLPGLMAIKKAQGIGTDGTTTYDGVDYPAYYCYVDNGDVVNNTNDALRDVIWNALNTGITRSTRVFHPEEGSDPFVGDGRQEVIVATAPWTNSTDAWGDISVEEINGTSTTENWD